jgi:hypothetical protein
LDFLRFAASKSFCDNQVGIQDKDGNRWKYIKTKSCLVAHGFEQQKGINYEKTFAPIVKWAIT